MHVLPLQVIDQQTAVGVKPCEGDAVVLKQPHHDGVPDLAEVAGHDQIIVVRRAAGVGKVRLERLVGCGRHGRAHIVRVRDARVGDLAGRHHRHARPVARRTENERAGAGDGPLRGRCAHAAVLQREPVLPLGRAEVRARERGGVFGVAAVDEHGGQTERFRHRRARAVQPQIGHTDVSHGIGRAHALVEQVTGEHIVELLRLQPGFLAHEVEALPQHGALGLFPALRAEIRVLTDTVKAVVQRSLALLFAHDAGGGEDHGRRGKLHGLRSDSFGFQAITFDGSVSVFAKNMRSAAAHPGGRAPVYVPLYFRRVAMPPRMCRSALLRSSSCRTC